MAEPLKFNTPKFTERCWNCREMFNKVKNNGLCWDCDKMALANAEMARKAREIEESTVDLKRKAAGESPA